MRAQTIATLGLTLVLAGIAAAWPDSAVAAELYKEIQEPSFRQFWEFSRSLVNYVLVAALLVAAFANVLRINIDTYGVKKALPTLMVGFLLANFSLFIVTMFLNIAAVLTTEAMALGGSALGQPGAGVWQLYYERMLSGLGALAIGGTGIIAGLVIAGATSGGLGLILGILVAAVVLCFPLIVGYVLVLLFLVRHYVVLALAGLAPVAFIAMAFPFTQKLFQLWWKQFATWVFMKPIAYLIMSLAVIVMNIELGSGALRAVIPFVLGITGLAFAVIVPFKAGGAVMATVANLSKQGLLAGRGGLGASGNWLATRQGNKWYQKAARGLGSGVNALHGLSYTPEKIKESIEKQQKLTEARGQAGAYRILQKKYEANRISDAITTEKQKEYEDEPVEEMARMFAEGKIKENEHLVAMMRRLYAKGDDAKFFSTVNAELQRLDKKDTAAAGKLRDQLGLEAGKFVDDTGEGKADATLSLLGAEKEKEIFDEAGNKVGIVLKEDARLLREREILQAYAKKNGHVQEAETVARVKPGEKFKDSAGNDIAAGAVVRFEGKAAISKALTYTGLHPQNDAREADYFGWIKEIHNADGTKSMVLKDDKLEALKQGRYDTMIRSHGNNFNTNTAAVIGSSEVMGYLEAQAKTAEGAEKRSLEAFMEMIKTGGNIRDLPARGGGRVEGAEASEASEGGISLEEFGGGAEFGTGPGRR